MRATAAPLNFASLPGTSNEPPNDTNNPASTPEFDADGALSRAFLLARGYCCGLGCKNCPYPADEHPTLPCETA